MSKNAAVPVRDHYYCRSVRWKLNATCWGEAPGCVCVCVCVWWWRCVYNVLDIVQDSHKHADEFAEMEAEIQRRWETEQVQIRISAPSYLDVSDRLLWTSNSLGSSDSFAVSGPTSWNSLPQLFCDATLTLGQFQRRMKASLFRLTYGRDLTALRSWLSRRLERRSIRTDWQNSPCKT